MLNSGLLRNIILFTVIIGTAIGLIYYYDSEQKKKAENGEAAATLQDILGGN